MSTEYLLNATALSAKLCLSKSQIYAMVKDGQLPLPIPVGKGASRWRGSDIDGWVREMASRPRVAAVKAS